MQWHFPLTVLWLPILGTIIDITAAADDYKATATTLGSIICTADGNTLVSATSGEVTLTATNNSLAAKRYYVKSSSANNLVVEASNYVYSVSEATVDKVFVQPGQTVTVSYTVSTNDPAATLAQDYANVTFNGAPVAYTATANGFTFTIPSDVEAAKELSLLIPAGAIGYALGSTFNAEQTITLKTPAVFDGIYFFRVENETAAKGKYLSRGGSYGTHATIDKYGLPIIVTTDGENNTTLSPADTKRYYYHGNTYDCWADDAVADYWAQFNITLSEGKYLIRNIRMADGLYLKYNDANVNDAIAPVFDNGDGNNDGPIIKWAIEKGAEHAVVMQALKDNQAATAAAAAFASGNYASLDGITDVASLETELNANYIQGDFVAPSAISSVREKYQGDQPNPAPETVYSSTIHIAEPGFYKFSMQAFYRAASNENTQAMHNAGADFPPVVLFFGDSETQIKSLYDENGGSSAYVAGNDAQYNGMYYANNMDAALKMFKEDKFHNDVWFYASAAGDYTYGVKYMGFANASMQWFIYSPESVTITSYAAAADATDYQNLNDAIAAAEGKTLGFDKDEYAPYNNADAIVAIAAAKAIDQTAVNSKLLVNSAIADMNTWVANTEEVNAFGDPTFSKSGNDGVQLGWTTDHSAGLGGSYHARAFVLESGDNYNKLAVFGQGDGTRSAGYFRFDGTNSAKTTTYTYGSTEGYTMPLKNVRYLMTAQLGGWGQADKDVVLQIVDESNDVVGSQTVRTPANGVNGGGPVVNVMFEFEPAAAGNYKLLLKNGSDADNAIVISNLMLMRAPVYTIVGDDELFGTYWDVNDANNELTLNTDGTYSKTYTGKALTGNVEYKVVKNHDYANGQWPASNRVIGINMPGTYDVTIHFNPATNEVYETMALYKSITAAKYATLYAPYDLNFEGTGVTAYTATVNNSEVTFNEVTAAKAYTGLLLKADEDTYKLPMEACATDTPSDLKGVTTDTPVAAGIFVLMNGGKGVGFYKTTQEFTVGAYTAYLKALPNSSRDFIGFGDDTTTGIEALSTKAMDGEVYNLQGQRVNKAHKGLYIVNGKKVVLK